jgi:hypothetical protein
MSSVAKQRGPVDGVFSTSGQVVLAGFHRPVTDSVQALSNEIFKEQKLNIGLDLGHRWSFNCVLEEAGKVILEQKVPTT